MELINVTVFLLSILSGVLVAGLRYTPPRTYHRQPGGEDPGDPLILTTYIKNGETSQGEVHVLDHARARCQLGINSPHSSLTQRSEGHWRP